MARALERVRSDQAAAILGVTATTLRGMVDRVDFPGIAKLGGMWTFDIKELEKFKRKREAAMAAKSAPTAPRDTIYFVQCGYHIKIGYTKTLQSRLATIQTSNVHEIELLASFDGTKAGERQLHEQFKEHRVRGEWFRDCRAIRSWLKRHRGALA